MLELLPPAVLTGREENCVSVVGRQGVSRVLSPRRWEGAARMEDLAEKAPLMTGQRVRRQVRLQRRVKRSVQRALRVATTAFLLVTLAVAGSMGLGWLLTSPRFAVTQIEVSGHSRLSRDTVIAASGLMPGENLFGLDARRAAAAIEALPEVRRAEVVRHFPDRVVVHVDERRPFTLVHAGHLHWVDEHGVPAGVESRAVAIPVPVISGLSPDELATASRWPSERATAGLALIRLLLRSGGHLVAQISEVDVSRPEGPVLYTVDGVEVRLGRDDWENRLLRLGAVLAQVASSGEPVSSIDLRFRDLVVLKPAVR